jgi:hypothetical protein
MLPPSEGGDGPEAATKRQRGEGEPSFSAAPPAAPLAPPRDDARRAFRFFDRLGAGFLSAGDLEAILQNAGPQLPRRAVHGLVTRALGIPFSERFVPGARVFYGRLLG